MKKLILAFLPLILAILLNPWLVLNVYEGISVEKPNALILVNGLKSELKAKSGDKISVDLSYTVTETTTLRVERLSDSKLEIDYKIVNGSVVSLDPGKHLVHYQAIIPEVGFLEKREILILQPMTSSEKSLILIPLIQPRNWESISMMLIPIGILLTFVGAIGTVLNLMNIRELIRSRVEEEEKQRLENELKSLQGNMNVLKNKILNLVDLLSSLAIKYGISMDEIQERIKNYSFSEGEYLVTTGKGMENAEKESIPEEESPVRVVLPLRKLVNRIRRA